MKVAVYWNLHKDCFSIQSREKENYGKVIAHIDSVALIKPKFVVRQAGREKVLKEGNKNVHAFVVGHLDDAIFTIMHGPGKLVTYNPYKYNSFVNKATKKPIEQANYVRMKKVSKFPVMEAW